MTARAKRRTHDHVVFHIVERRARDLTTIRAASA